MGLHIGSIAPDLTAETSEGPPRFHEFPAQSWGALHSGPRDFTPACTTELGYAVIAQSEESQSRTLGGPIVADSNREVSKLSGMMDR